MQADRQAARARTPGSRVTTLAAWLLGLLIVADGLLCLRIWLGGPLQLEARSLPAQLMPANPLYALPVLVLAWCGVRWRRWRGWLGLREGERLRLRRPKLLACIAMAASVALLGAQLRAVTWEVVSVPARVRKSARTGAGGTHVSGANRHAPPLVRTLVQRESAEPVVVWIEDLDVRGHTAAFYLYPRLLLMEPKLRRWSLRERMRIRGKPDPQFFVGPRPAKALSQAFADERGTQLVFASRPGGPKRNKPR